MSAAGPVADAATAEPTRVTIFEPFTVHFFVSRLVRTGEMRGEPVSYGRELLVTPSVWAFARDDDGFSWLDLLDSEAGQVERYGRVCFRRGPWPEGVPRTEPGSADDAQRIADAWREAWSLPSEEERTARRAELRAQYGNPPTASRTLGHETGSER